MGGSDGFDGQDAQVDVLYERANERLAKAVAFLGSYLIWGALGAAALGFVVISL